MATGLKQAFALGSLFLIVGCAGPDKAAFQEVEVQSFPPLATCRAYRAGQLAGMVLSTPGVITLVPDSRELRIECNKYGFESGETTITSHQVPGSPAGFAFDPVIRIVLTRTDPAKH